MNYNECLIDLANFAYRLLMIVAVCVLQNCLYLISNNNFEALDKTFSLNKD